MAALLMVYAWLSQRSCAQANELRLGERQQMSESASYVSHVIFQLSFALLPLLPIPQLIEDRAPDD